MSAPTWEELREDGRVIFDFPGRKLAIYPNDSGGVILLMVDEGRRMVFDLDPADYAGVKAGLAASMAEAAQVSRVLDAEYDTWQAIEKARS